MQQLIYAFKHSSEYIIFVEMLCLKYYVQTFALIIYLKKIEKYLFL